MKPAIIVLLFGMVFSSFAFASEESEWNKALEIPCHATLTAAECRQHYDLLARLPQGSAREAYLAEHFAMIQDRAAACGCSAAQNAVGALRLN